METLQETNPSTRRMSGVTWYWIDRSLLRVYGRKLKPSGIAVYNAMASFANFKTQACFPSQKTMAELIGVGPRTVMRKTRQLKELGLIAVEERKGGRVYHLLQAEAEVTKETAGGVKSGASKVTGQRINNTYITKMNNDKGIGFNNFEDDVNASKGFRPQTREELLALDLAEALGDLEGLPLYLSYARRYPGSILRGFLGEVREMPSGQIKKSRAALFNHLIQTYAQRDSKNPGDQPRNQIPGNGRP